MIDLLVTSPPDRNRVVVELWRKDVQLAEVSNEDGVLRVEFYAAPNSRAVMVELGALEAALQAARAELTRDTAKNHDKAIQGDGGQ